MKLDILKYIFWAIGACFFIAAFVIVAVMEYSTLRTVLIVVCIGVFALSAVPASCIQYKERKADHDAKKNQK